MTTYVTFTPSQQGAPQFQATFDGDLYTVIVRANLFGQRFYVDVYAQDGSLVLARSLVGSPPAPAAGLNLIGGYFTTSTLVFRQATQQFEISP
ncbi:MAG TPA: hypothetical protein VGC09_00510 [Rhodopila sp.]